MRTTIRFVLPIVAAITLVAFLVMPFTERFTKRWFMRDLDMRTKLIASTLYDQVIKDVEENKGKNIGKIFEKVTLDERLFAIAYCQKPDSSTSIYRSKLFPDELTCHRSLELSENDPIVDFPKGPLHIAYIKYNIDGQDKGGLVLVHDAQFIENRHSSTKQYLNLFFIALAIIISIITVILAKLGELSWIKNVRHAITAETWLTNKDLSSVTPEVRPILRDVKELLKDLQSTKKSRDDAISWTPKVLKGILQKDLSGDEVIVVSNRQPYIHMKKGDKIEILYPASGLVTAVEPIMRACSGTWIAHGNGSADREVVDDHDRIKVPPENPLYQIRRVWLTKEEENGHYYGFANEGLWPLCHIAHVRPIFRLHDWEHYVAVNKKFAKAVAEESKSDDPVILVQDYHFALLPKMIRELLPKATIITFWHIPWPNPESFGICPWRVEILDGLLGSDIIGFHTRYHCNNFFETVDRTLECRIERENNTISYRGDLTSIQSYPISIEHPSRWLDGMLKISECRNFIREKHSIPNDSKVAIGVDRLDYTKGITERLLSTERLFERFPELIGKFTLVQIAAPSRTSIEEYQRLENGVRSLAARINHRFGNDNYKPIILLIEHHNPFEIFKYYRGADICLVTSLHDGMNLVAKEFVAARDDEQGVLILSRFAGAARELPEALIVNPYDMEECSSAIKIAIEMGGPEQKSRMQTMRGLIQEFNVYRWASRMLIDASQIRKRSRLKRKYGV